MNPPPRLPSTIFTISKSLLRHHFGKISGPNVTHLCKRGSFSSKIRCFDRNLFRFLPTRNLLLIFSCDKDHNDKLVLIDLSSPQNNFSVFQEALPKLHMIMVRQSKKAFKAFICKYKISAYVNTLLSSLHDIQYSKFCIKAAHICK